jgi:hypothetical protein
VFVLVHIVVLSAWLGMSWGLPATMASMLDDVHTQGLTAVLPVQVHQLTQGAVGTLQAAAITYEPEAPLVAPTVVQANDP